MNRRDLLRRASLLAAGAVAADQLELIERLGWTRRLFPGWSPTTVHHPMTTLEFRTGAGDIIIIRTDQLGREIERVKCVSGVASFSGITILTS